MSISNQTLYQHRHNLTQIPFSCQYIVRSSIMNDDNNDDDNKVIMKMKLLIFIDIMD